MGNNILIYAFYLRNTILKIRCIQFFIKIINGNILIRKKFYKLNINYRWNKNKYIRRRRKTKNLM